MSRTVTLNEDASRLICPANPAYPLSRLEAGLLLVARIQQSIARAADPGLA